MKAACLLLAFAALAAEPAPDPNRGVFAIWLRDGQNVALPHIKGGQVVVQWADVEPEPGRYDFSALDRQLEAQHKLGRVTTIQLNGNGHPAWLFRRVPYIGKALSIQVRDKQGTLAYWHENYRTAYENLIAAYAKHVKTSPLRASVLGIRFNYNALGTEHWAVEEADRAPSLWTTPPGVSPAPRWTPEIGNRYRRAIMDAFMRNFAPEVRVFMRNNAFGEKESVEPSWIRALRTGRLALFHTSSEMEPRKASRQYDVFKEYCRPGQTVCYAEPWADAWGNHGGKKDPRWCGPEQFNYWRVLVDLNCGVSFIAFYGADLAHAAEPEFRAAFDFAALYAGYHASPSVSPGAWVALREGNTLKGDYTFLMKRSGDEMKPVELAGPREQRYGAWARALAKGGAATFELDPAFARSLEGRAASIQVIYLDEGQGSLTVMGGGEKWTTRLKNTGRWQTVKLPLERAAFAGPVRITADRDITLHMVEVRR